MSIIAFVFLISVGIFILAYIVQYVNRDKSYPKIEIEDWTEQTTVFIDRFVDDFEINTKKSKKKGKDKEEEFA